MERRKAFTSAIVDALMQRRKGEGAKKDRINTIESAAPTNLVNPANLVNSVRFFLCASASWRLGVASYKIAQWLV
jgi:hypothetical protein